MKAENLIYGEKLLVMLNEIGGEITFKQFEEKCSLKGDELRELLKYLVKKEYVVWKNPMFINGTILSPDRIKLTHKGMEVVLGKREFFEEGEKILQKIQNQTNVSNSSEFNVAQTTGDDSSIIQIQDNSQINVLKQLIENDEELDKQKKEKLFGILEKFNTLKESGENALELIKTVGGVALKYVPLFFSLLH